jgi:hypothetical protein
VSRSKTARRSQAPKRRVPDLSVLRPQVTIPETCRTGHKPLPYSIARAMSRNGGTIVECYTCDWYHVQEEET